MGGVTLDPNITLVVVAFLNLITAFLAWRTHEQSKSNATNIAMLEKNTNSIKDALVVSVSRAAFAAGETKAREAGIEIAKDLLKENKK